MDSVNQVVLAGRSCQGSGLVPSHYFIFQNSCCLTPLNVLVLGLFQVKSKLDILSSYADVTDGLVTHGWITKIEKHGCFVRFYNGVQGFAPR